VKSDTGGVESEDKRNPGVVRRGRGNGWGGRSVGNGSDTVEDPVEIK